MVPDAKTDLFDSFPPQKKKTKATQNEFYYD